MNDLSAQLHLINEAQPRTHDIAYLRQFFFDYQSKLKSQLGDDWTDDIFNGIAIFVNDCMKRKEPGFLISTKSDGQVFVLKQNLLAKVYLNQIERFLSIYSTDCFFSPIIELFYSACRSLGIHSDTFFQLKGRDATGVQAAELFNRLVDCIRQFGRSKAYRKNLSSINGKIFGKFINLVNYANALFDKRSRLMVIRLDLKYSKEHAASITAEDAQRDLKHFLDNKRGKPSLFDDLIGYIWKMEYGGQGGCHFHLFLFFTNDRLLMHDHRAEEVGKYWSEVITKGRGEYFSCNRKEYLARQKKPCIGRIERSDDGMRANLLYALAYFCKDQQGMPVKMKKQGRSLGRGRMPCCVTTS